MKFFILLLSALIIVSLTSTTFRYLIKQNDIHSQEYSDSVWGKLTNNLSGYSADSNKVSVIILTDRETRQKIDNSVAFGFNYHYGLIHKIWSDNELPPVWVVEGNIIDKAKIHPNLLDPTRRILVFEIKGDQVKDLTPKAKF